eukprot:101111_1
MPRKSYIRMAFDARKGVSDGAHFNTALRNALKSGISRGVLEHGITNQRFKLTVNGIKENKQCNNSKKYPIDKKGKKKQEIEKKKKIKQKIEKIKINKKKKKKKK